MTCPPTWRMCWGRPRHVGAAGAVKTARRAQALTIVEKAERVFHAGKTDYG